MGICALIPVKVAEDADNVAGLEGLDGLVNVGAGAGEIALNGEAVNGVAVLNVEVEVVSVRAGVVPVVVERGSGVVLRHNGEVDHSEEEVLILNVEHLIVGKVHGGGVERAVKQLEELGFMHSVSCRPDYTCQNKEVREAFKNVCDLTGLKGRWQKIKDEPLTICDTGHNVAGWTYLSEQLKAVTAKHKHIVFGMVADKDVEGVMELLPKDATYYFTKADSKRSTSESLLKLYAQKHNLTGEGYPDVASAYKAAQNAAGEKDFVFIGGSSYVVADFLKNCI